MVTRVELRQQIWGSDTHVDFDRGINKAVNRLRQVLADDLARPRFIETLPKRGYRFVAGVTRLAARQQIRDDAREAFLKASTSGTSAPLMIFDAASSTSIARSNEIPIMRSHGPGLRTRTSQSDSLGSNRHVRSFLRPKQLRSVRYRWTNRWPKRTRSSRKFRSCTNGTGTRRSDHIGQAIQLNPNYAVAHHWYSQLLSILARHHEAHEEIEIARRCDPLSATIAAFASYVAFEARQYDVAVSAAHEALELDSHAPVTHFLLGRAYSKIGRTSSAISALEKALSAGWFPQAEAALGYVYARAGNRSQAEQILAALRTRRLTQYVSPIDVAQVCLGLGDIDGAITALEEGYGTRAARMVIIGDPFFSALAPDARYRQLMARLRLPTPA